MLKTNIKGFQRALQRKANAYGISVEEYCENNTDMVILENGEDDSPLHWNSDGFDFVVFGDLEEAREESLETDTIVPVVTWLQRNGIITNEFHLS